jgi:hypothetical protein
VTLMTVRLLCSTVFERTQEREAHLASTKGKGREEDYTLSSSENSTMSLHPVPDLLSWEDGDGKLLLSDYFSFINTCKAALFESCILLLLCR